MTGLLTHFYARPNKRSPKRAFLNVGKKVIVTTQAEKNGFYYVVYTNKKGQRISGWLPKKVLRPVRLTTPLYSS